MRMRISIRPPLALTRRKISGGSSLHQQPSSLLAVLGKKTSSSWLAAPLLGQDRQQCCWSSSSTWTRFHYDGLPRRGLSTSSSSSSRTDPDEDDDDEPDQEQRDQQEQYQQEYQHRHPGIAVHPDSISKEILPGNFVIKKSRRSGGGGENKKQTYTELVYGYFWMLKDLRRSDEKPIQSNAKLIPEKVARVFPTLSGLQSLSSSEKLRLPDHFLRKNRSRDPSAQCTLVAVAYRDFGYQLLDSWIEPFQEQMKMTTTTTTTAAGGGNDSSNSRVEVFRLNISDGFMNKWILRGLIHGLMKRNTPESQRDHTLLYFGNASPELENFRDALRMHNVMTGYVFLLDGLGRVRFAGSGPASQDETERLVRFAKDLLTTPGSNRGTGKKRHFRGESSSGGGGSGKKKLPARGGTRPATNKR